MRSPCLTAFLSTCVLASLSCSSGTSEGTGSTSSGVGGALSQSAGASSTSTSGSVGAGGSNSGATNGGAANAGAPSSGAANAGAPSSGAANGGTANGGALSSGGGASAGAGMAGTASGSGGTAGMAGSGGGSTVVFPPNCTCLGLGPPVCTPTGHVTYTLAKAASPTADQLAAYDLITCAMDGAVAYYNCNTSITKQLNVTYDTSVPTADGNFNGSVRFGGHSYMECATGMHETAHAVGVGTTPKWPTYSVGGVFTGTNAIAQLRAITGNATDVLHSDTQHFWPYGLNYASEAGSTADLVDHCLMVTAIRKDLGLQ
jgi:hypothetical protein